jgi:hypothetical protein
MATALELLHKYEVQQTSYCIEGTTQTTHMFLRAISTSAPKAYKKLPLLRLLSEASKELMLNELEVALWAIYLERLVWPVTDTQLSLVFAAFSVKLYLNDDTEPIEAQLSRRIANFSGMYESWTEDKQFTVSPRELNSKFRALTSLAQQPEDEAIVDYNYYVDDILQIAPATTHAQEPPLCEVKEEVFEDLSLDRNMSISSDWMQAFIDVSSLSRVNSRL